MSRTKLEKAMAPTPVFLPGKSHGRRSLVGYSPWGLKESDTTERLHFHFSLSCIGEGNGNPLQRSCLENPRDGGAWWAAVCGVAQSQTRLKRLSSSSSSSSWNSALCQPFVWCSIHFSEFTISHPAADSTCIQLVFQRTTSNSRQNIHQKVQEKEMQTNAYMLIFFGGARRLRNFQRSGILPTFCVYRCASGMVHSQFLVFTYLVQFLEHV